MGKKKGRNPTDKAKAGSRLSPRRLVRSPALIGVLLAVGLVAGEPAAVGGDEIEGAF